MSEHSNFIRIDMDKIYYVHTVQITKYFSSLGYLIGCFDKDKKYHEYYQNQFPSDLAEYLYTEPPINDSE